MNPANLTPAEPAATSDLIARQTAARDVEPSPRTDPGRDLVVRHLGAFLASIYRRVRA